MKKNKRTIWLLVITNVLLAGLLLSGCEQKHPGGPPPTSEVAFITTNTESVVTTTELAGRTSANLVAEVRPQVSGIIQDRLFTEGANVKAGQPLFKIDPATYWSASDNAKAALARSEAKLPAIQLKVNRLKDLLNDKAESQQD